jgi:hypothetical protein
MAKPLYLVPLSIYPVLHIYSQNLGIITDGPVPVAAAVSLGLATAFYWLFRLFGAQSDKSALATSVGLAVFFSYGHLYTFLDDTGRAAWHLWLLPGLAFVAVLVLLVIERRPPGADFRPLNTILNVAGGVMLVFPLISILSWWAGILTQQPDSKLIFEGPPERAEKLLDGPANPDIYYIITDGYSSNAHLQRAWNYDNSSFTDALEELGFFVAYESKSNYGATLHSLSSTLNMRYMGENPNAPDVDDLVYLRMQIADYAVARRLMESGYSYVYMLSGFLLPSSIADVNVDFGPHGVMEYRFRDVASSDLEFDHADINSGAFYKGSFLRVLADTTLLRLWSDQLTPLLLADRPYLWDDTRRFFASLDHLETIVDMPEATFAFVHLFEPHGPVQLNRDGTKKAESTWRPKPKDFFAELELVNEHLLAALRMILERSSTAPVIILQGDHGTDLGYVWTQDRHLTHFEIMHAIHLPEGVPKGLSPALSPINTFGIVMRELFGFDYVEQPDRYFDLPKGYKGPFDQIEVTDTFRSSRDASPVGATGK